MTDAVHLRSVRAHVFRAPIDTPVMTSFGTMRDRPMVLVEAEDHDGARGWGEVWCNYPNVGAEHRARLVESILGPLSMASRQDGPEQLFRHLTTATEVLAIQCGEAGSFAQAIAGIDIAVWDLVARKQGLPLSKLLGGSSPSIRVYASGLNPSSPEVLAKTKHEEGYRAFKLKIGFGADRDVANLEALRNALGHDVDLMVAANQGWSLEEALATVPRLEQFMLNWLEEPLRADRPWAECFLASAHLLAAVGGSGRLEIDANANPLRTLLSGPLKDVWRGPIYAENGAEIGDRAGRIGGDRSL